MTNQRMRLPSEECEWCGATIKYIRIVRNGQTPDKALTAAIDAEPCAWTDPAGKLVRIPARQADGRIDCARMCPEEERWLHERFYSLHRETCPNRAQWTGPKKWVAVLRQRDEDRARESGNPEILAAESRSYGARAFSQD